jgi:hypothetical protein
MPALEKEGEMLDLFFIAVSLGYFVLNAAFAYACNLLMGDKR